jgi:hydroxypyruvate isomerase
MATPSKPAQKTARAVEGPRAGAAGNQARVHGAGGGKGRLMGISDMETTKVNQMTIEWTEEEIAEVDRLRRAARSHTREALRVLVEIMNSKDAPPMARVRAAKVLRRHLKVIGGSMSNDKDLQKIDG